MYDRQIDDQLLTFGVSGKLIRNALVMYDRETDSLWSQMLGEAVAGPLQSTPLTFQPSWMMSWGQWQAEYPDTVALDKGGLSGRDPYANGYYESEQAGIIPETYQDERLFVKEFVLGVEIGEIAIAYPFRFLNEEPVLNHEVDNRPVLVVFDKTAASAVAFSREVNGQVYTFTATDQPFVVQDQETGSLWSVTAGQATAGELAGTSLPRLKSSTVFWFGWKDFFPNTLIYKIPSSP